MRNFLFLVSFMMVFGQVITGFAEKLTLEEEEEAFQALRDLSHNQEAFSLQFYGEKDTTGVSQAIQQCLDLREQYAHSRWVGCALSNMVGYYYMWQGRLEKALEYFQWVTSYYADEIEEVVAYIFSEGGQQRYDELVLSLSPGSTEYKEAKLENHASDECFSALIAEAAVLFRLEQYEEANHIYIVLRRIQNAPGPTPGGSSFALLTQGEFDMIANDTGERGDPKFKEGATPIQFRKKRGPGFFNYKGQNLFQYRGRYLYDNMLYLIEQKQGGKK